MPGSLAHLSERFFDVLTARRLSAAELDSVRERLPPELMELFEEQSKADQRHGYEAGMVVLGSGVEADDVVAAALLHDIGKRHARLGIVGRTIASLAIKMSLPLTARMTTYRDHGIVGAKDLAGAGAAPLVVDFALHHHGAKPPSIDVAVWDLLVRADQPSKTKGRLGSGITSNGT